MLSNIDRAKMPEPKAGHTSLYLMLLKKNNPELSQLLSDMPIFRQVDGSTGSIAELTPGTTAGLMILLCLFSLSRIYECLLDTNLLIGVRWSEKAKESM